MYSCIFHILPNVLADAKNSFAFVVDFFFFLAKLLSNLIIADFPSKSRKHSIYFLRKSAYGFPCILDVCCAKSVKVSCVVKSLS